MEFHMAKWFCNARGWYWLPRWLNCYSWEKGLPKAYRWLFFGWVIKTHK